MHRNVKLKSSLAVVLLLAGLTVAATQSQAAASVPCVGAECHLIKPPSTGIGASEPYAGCSLTKFSMGARREGPEVYVEAFATASCQLPSYLLISWSIPCGSPFVSCASSTDSTSCVNCRGLTGGHGDTVLAPTKFCDVLVLEFHHGGVTEKYDQSFCV